MSEFVVISFYLFFVVYRTLSIEEARSVHAALLPSPWFISSSAFDMFEKPTQKKKQLDWVSRAFVYNVGRRVLVNQPSLDDKLQFPYTWTNDDDEYTK